MSELTQILLAFSSLVTLLAGGLAFLFYRRSERMKELYESERTGTQEMMKERDEKLLSNSRYSEMGMMAAGIAHEINNPLAVIQARASQLLRRNQEPGRQKELDEGLKQILSTSERIKRTIQGVRAFAHQDEYQSSSEVNLKELIEDVLAFTGQRLKNHGISLRLYGMDNRSVWGNKIQLEQVILNLLNNSFDAIEFLPDKWIEVSAYESEDKLQIQVKDSGQGVPVEIATRMMDPFFSTKEIGKGTGLGLAMAKGIVEKHGGKLSYLPDRPHTTFLLELPVRPSMEWGMQAYH